MRTFRLHSMLAEAWTLAGSQHRSWDETSFIFSSTCTCTLTYTFYLHWQYIYIDVFLFPFTFKFTPVIASTFIIICTHFLFASLRPAGLRSLAVTWLTSRGGTAPDTPAADNKHITICPSHIHIHRARHSTARYLHTHIHTFFDD